MFVQNTHVQISTHVWRSNKYKYINIDLRLPHRIPHFVERSLKINVKSPWINWKLPKIHNPCSLIQWHYVGKIIIASLSSIGNTNFACLALCVCTPGRRSVITVDEQRNHQNAVTCGLFVPHFAAAHLLRLRIWAPALQQSIPFNRQTKQKRETFTLNVSSSCWVRAWYIFVR